MDSKNSLRNKVLALRKNMKRENAGILSKIICNTLISSESYKKAYSVFCYYPVRNEVDLTSFINKALQDKKVVSLPRVTDKNGIMKFYQINSLDELSKGAYGIPEPNIKDEQKGADLIIVPGVVFSESGDRIGQAGGFYDRYLAENDIYSVGVCYDYQIYKKIPYESHDIRMNNIVSDKRTIFIK